MPGSKPQITGTRHHLPYNSLSPTQFEELCFWLVQREGFVRAEHLGAAGSEQGRDVIAWQDGEQWVFQCKRVQSFTKSLANREITKLRDELTERKLPVPKHYVFVTSCLISAEIRDQLRQEYGGQFDLHFWALTELDEKVNKHRDILQQFFEMAAEDDPGEISLPESVLEIPLEGIRQEGDGFIKVDLLDAPAGKRWAQAARLIGLIGLALVVLYGLGRWTGLLSPSPTPTATPTEGAAAITPSPIMPVSITPTQTPTYTSTQSPSPTHTGTPTPTLTSTSTPTPTATITPTITPFPIDCFALDTWIFDTGYAEPLPTRSTLSPACYNAERWGFYATDGIVIGADNTETEIRGVRYPLPAGDAHIWADITLTNISRSRSSSVVDLIVGIGKDPWELDNKVFNWWFYFIRDWGAESISQCVLFDFTSRCEAQEAITSLPDLPPITPGNPLRLELDIRITNRRVEVVLLYPQEDGSLVSTQITNFRPLSMDLAWWLWVGYRTHNGGSIDSRVELYMTTPTPTPSGR